MRLKRISARRRWSLVGATLLALGCGVTDDQEVSLGQQTAREMNARLPLVTDPRVTDYVTHLGMAIARTTSRADLDWKFYVVNTPDVNAFALPGGFIYVNRGLIERTQRLDQLAGTLGHEIGHVVRRHSVEQMKKASGANAGIALVCTLTSLCDSRASRVVINVAGSALFAKYSRTDEAEADSEAVVNVIRAGIDPDGVPELFEVLLRERQRNPNALDGFFASHPFEEDRVAHTRDLIAQYDQHRLEGLTSDDPNYAAFKRELAALPMPRPRPRAP
jgi:predicted Zn-dependent protease